MFQILLHHRPAAWTDNKFQVPINRTIKAKYGQKRQNEVRRSRRRKIVLSAAFNGAFVYKKTLGESRVRTTAYSPTFLKNKNTLVNDKTRIMQEGMRRHADVKQLNMTIIRKMLRLYLLRCPVPHLLQQLQLRRCARRIFAGAAGNSELSELSRVSQHERMCDIQVYSMRVANEFSRCSHPSTVPRP